MRILSSILPTVYRGQVKSLFVFLYLMSYLICGGCGPRCDLKGPEVQTIFMSLEAPVNPGTYPMPWVQVFDSKMGDTMNDLTIFIDEHQNSVVLNYTNSKGQNVKVELTLGTLINEGPFCKEQDLPPSDQKGGANWIWGDGLPCHEASILFREDKPKTVHTDSGWISLDTPENLGSDMVGPGSSDVVSDPGTRTGDAVKSDAKTPKCPGAVGCSCVENFDCDSGVCVPSLDGSVCTQTCVLESAPDQCPDYFTCVAIEQEDQSSALLCLSRTINLCKPCSTNLDCREGSADASAQCMSFGDEKGSFCGIDCSNGNSCPEGYACEAFLDPNDSAPITQCIPITGECDAVIESAGQ